LGFEVIVILFLLLSVGSSIISKLQQRKQTSGEVGRQGRTLSPSQRRPIYQPEEDEADASDWEVLSEVFHHRTESLEEEFREVKGTRSVTEEPAREEFRPTQVTRPVEEPPAQEEFRPVRPEPKPTPAPRPQGPPPETATSQKAHLPHAKKAKRRRRLDFSRGSVRNAILYREILGPPRSEEMP